MKKQNVEYQTKDILEVLDLPRECLREWIFRDFVDASIKIPQKGRILNLFSGLDVYRITLFKHLVQTIHIPRRVASKLSKSMNYEDAGKSFLLFLAPEGEEFYEFSDVDILVDMPEIFETGGWDYQIVIPWEKLKSDVDEKLSRQ